MTTKKKVLIGVGVLAVVGIGYLIYSQTKQGAKPTISWRFTDNHWGADANHKLGFIGLTKPPFSVGDAINIAQDSGAKNIGYNGNTTVSSIKAVDGKWVVSVPKSYRGSTPVNAGVITK